MCEVIHDRMKNETPWKMLSVSVQTKLVGKQEFSVVPS